MSVRSMSFAGRRCRMRLGLAVGALVVTGCLGERLRGRVAGTQTALQRAIQDGSKRVECAPKETAWAEANIKFAEDALVMGEYHRAQEHADLAETYTKLARAKTDPVRCGEGGPVREAAARVGDLDGDGYDDAIDKCPQSPEDFDAFEDKDGCPDPDNDGDGILDAFGVQAGVWQNADRDGARDCRSEPEDHDGFQDKDGCPDPDNDEDGILDASDKCPDVAEDLDNFEDDDGCPEADNDGDKILDPNDPCPNQAEDFDGDRDEDGCPDRKAEFDGCSVKISEKVFFKFNKWDIDPRSFELLGDVAAVMTEVPAELHFRVEGHTDGKGSDTFNKKLSQKRADAVRSFLVQKGIASARLTATGFGEEQPIDSNRTEDGRARNRRVEFNVSNVDCKPKP